MPCVSLDALPCPSPTLQFGFFQQLLTITLPSQSLHPMFRGSPLPQLLLLSGRWGFREGRDRNYPPMLLGAGSLKSRSHRATQLQQHLWGPLASFHFQAEDAFPGLGPSRPSVFIGSSPGHRGLLGHSCVRLRTKPKASGLLGQTALPLS